MPYRRGKQPSVAFPVFVSGAKIVEHQVSSLDRTNRLIRMWSYPSKFYPCEPPCWK